MSLTHIDGLPAHVLFVHAVVVLVPLTALAAVVGAVRPQFARRMGLALPLLGLVTLGLVPVTTHAGEWLESRVGNDPLVRKHTELGDGLLPWAVALFLITLAIWWLGRRLAQSAETAEGVSSAGAARWTSPTVLRTAAVVLAVAVSAGAVVDVYRIGESGAKAAWHDSYDKSAEGHHG
ncbi:hypothetical protein NMG29_17105 [Streptomyces cocklensis]|jgi:hypothetical protein|uniref:DUF2231 domain-containing protein n=1 Tax=Actinacidiphila cocklensis TaxID=887465 RepID=A0A9W4DWH8_9ACTN|nr:DUF2231 domain-containing protein [Actinacidiphila cocklensis]MDD1059898.1 hypothetical protein [Actinacidiphila cocklensis]CAG6397206.1 conserved membrane hypothetical protein [Actinacidiphila cocklensis]